MKNNNSDLSVTTRNSVFALLLQVINIGYGFLVPRFVLAYYGSELNGLVSSITQFMQYFAMLESGLAVSATYSLFKPLSDHDGTSCSRIISECAYDYDKIGVFFSALLLMLAAIFPHFRNASSLSYLDCSLLIISIGFSYLIQYFIFSKYRAFLTACQAQYILSLCSILGLVVSTAAVYVCILVLHTGIVALKLVVALVPLIEYPIMAIYTRKHFPWIRMEKPHNYRMIQNRGTAFVNEIMGVVFYSSPVLILTAMENFLTVSVYAVYNLVYSGITTLFGTVNLAVSAMFGPYIAQNDDKLIRKRYAQFEGLYYYGSSLLLGCTCALTIPFIRIYTAGVHDVEYSVPVYAVLFAVNCWVNNSYTPQAIMIRAGGFFREVRIQTMIQTVLSVVLSLVLTPLYGIRGLLVSLIVSNLVRAAMAYYVIDYKLQYIDHVYSLKCLLISAVQMAVTAAVLPGILSVTVGTVDSFLDFIAGGFLSVLSGFLVMLVILRIFDRPVIGQMTMILRRYLKR